MAAKVTVNPNGPFKIEGDFEVVDAAGQPFDLKGKTTAFLCRCGSSKNAPFCDGSHKGCGFESDPRAVAGA